MKRVLIDIYKAKLPYSGLGQFSIHLAKELQKQSLTDIEFHFLYPESKHPLVPSEEQFLKANWKTRYLPFTGPSYDLWHSLHQFPSHKPPRHTAQILTLHDLNFLKEKNKVKAKRYLHRLQKNVNQAAVLTTISEFSKGEIEQNLQLHGKKIHVIHNGIQDIAGIQKQPPLGISNSAFLFTLGIFNAKKNFHSLLPMMLELPNYKLIIAGDNETAYGSDIKRIISELGLEKQVILLGKISEQEKQWLYAKCEAMVFPSIAEGFGMPVIEAMQHGKLVICSTYSALPEIGGEVARYFPSFDPSEMSKTVLTELELFYKNIELRELEARNYARKFNWHECTNAYIKLYRECLQL